MNHSLVQPKMQIYVCSCSQNQRKKMIIKILIYKSSWWQKQSAWVISWIVLLRLPVQKESRSMENKPGLSKGELQGEQNLLALKNVIILVFYYILVKEFHTANNCSEITVEVHWKDCNQVWVTVIHCMQYPTVFYCSE